MRIIVDARALMSGRTSGVTVYMRELLPRLFELDSQNEYVVFYNSFRQVDSVFTALGFEKFPNVKIVRTRIPNKIFNLCLRFFRWPKIDLLVARRLKIKSQGTIFFMPDPRPLALSKQVRLVTTFHDLSFERFPKTFSLKTRLWHWLLGPRQIAGVSKGILAVSNFTKQELMSVYGIPENKISLVYHGVNERFFREVSREEIAQVKEKYRLPQVYFLTLSTLEPRKNLPRLIAAFQKFREIHGDLGLVVAGDFQSDVFSPVEFPNQAEGIIFSGYVPENDQIALYAGAAGFIYLSFYEGFGLPVLEAAAQGLPLLVSHNSAITEIAPPDAIRINPMFEQEILNGLVALSNISSDQFYSDQFYSGRIRLHARKFSWKKSADLIKSVFDDATSSSRYTP